MTKAKVITFNKTKGILWVKLISGKYIGAEMVHFYYGRRTFKSGQRIKVSLGRYGHDDMLYIPSVF